MMIQSIMIYTGPPMAMAGPDVKARNFQKTYAEDGRSVVSSVQPFLALGLLTVVIMPHFAGRFTETLVTMGNGR